MKKFVVSCLFLILEYSIFTQAVHVEVVQDSIGSYSLLRDGKPYYIKGAGTTNISLFSELKARGGNSIRTWGVDAYSGRVLQEAHKNGLSVILGLWLKKEKDGFDYSDDARVEAQLESFRAYVRSYRNYPALLAWSIGNEVDMSYSNMKVWNAVNDIAKMIKEEDGKHPTLTITAGISTSKANEIAARAPDLDMLGVNVYAGISGVHSAVLNSNWEKPYLITEWGINGQWEVGETSWGAPFEPNSSQKTQMFLDRYNNYIAPYPDVLLGSYAFYWHSKFEASATWFGLFVDNHSTEMVDALGYCWTGEWVENLAPRVTDLRINSALQNSSLVIASRTGNTVTMNATDPEGDILSFEFLVLPESGNELVESISGSTFNAIPGLGGFSDSGSIHLDFQEKHNHRNLRLYALVRDGNGHIGTATFPFQTAFLPDDTATGITRDSEPSEYYTKPHDFILYPNPASGTFYIQSEVKTGMVDVYIYNSTGYLVEKLQSYDLSTKSPISVQKYQGYFLFFIEIRTRSGERNFLKLINS